MSCHCFKQHCLGLPGRVPGDLQAHVTLAKLFHLYDVFSFPKVWGSKPCPQDCVPENAGTVLRTCSLACCTTKKQMGFQWHGDPMGPHGFTRLHAWDPHQDHCSTLRLFKFNIIKNTSAELVNACRKEWGPCSGSARPRLRRACHPVPLDLPVLTLGRAARKRKLKTRQGGQV